MLLHPRAFLLVLGSCTKSTKFAEGISWRFADHGRSWNLASNLRNHVMSSPTRPPGFASSTKASSPSSSHSAASWFRAAILGLVPAQQQIHTISRRLGLKGLLTTYGKLSKLKLSVFVMSTACAGYVLGSGEEVEWSGLLWTGLGTLGAAACANTLNQVIEVKNDGMMSRTMSRPLPSGRISKGHALMFALLAGSAGVALLATKTNELTAALGAANIALYAGVYTPLKQITPLNTWVGAVVGAIPPLMGWAASSGQLDPGAWILAVTLYFWQIPHFLSLAWVCKDDYARAGYEMLSKYDPQGKRLASISLRNCFYMLPLGFLSVISGVTTTMFGYEAGILSVLLALSTSVFYSKPSKALGRATFRASLLFLPVFMTAMLVHRRPNEKTSDWQTVKEEIFSKLNPFSSKVNEEMDIIDESSSLQNFQNAPFPFVIVPNTLSIGLWEGLDQVISEEEHLWTEEKGKGKG